MLAVDKRPIRPLLLGHIAIDQYLGRAGDLEQRFEQERILLKKESESERRLAELQIQALQDQLARQSAEIEKQRAQVEDAKRQVQDIAIKAIEGASGAQALSHIDKIAMEQANPRSPQG